MITTIFNPLHIKTKKHLITLILIIGMLQSLAGQTADPSDGIPSLQEVLAALPATGLQQLMDNGQYMSFQSGKIKPMLMPDTPLATATIEQILAGNMTIGIEGVFFTPLDQLPGSWQDLPTEVLSIKLYNILRSVSTLTGLEYFSASRNKMRLLFEESWVIPSPDSPKEAIPDPLVDTIPVRDSFYIHQKDRSFHKNQSKMTFVASPQAFSATIVNLTPMRYKGFIKVVESGNMQTHLITIPVKEGLLVYGAMFAKTLEIKAFLNKAQNSFTNRVLALTQWYKDRVSEEF